MLLTLNVFCFRDKFLYLEKVFHQGVWKNRVIKHMQCLLHLSKWFLKYEEAQINLWYKPIKFRKETETVKKEKIGKSGKQIVKSAHISYSNLLLIHFSIQIMKLEIQVKNARLAVNCSDYYQNKICSDYVYWSSRGF